MMDGALQWVFPESTHDAKQNHFGAQERILGRLSLKIIKTAHPYFEYQFVNLASSVTWVVQGLCVCGIQEKRTVSLWCLCICRYVLVCQVKFMLIGILCFSLYFIPLISLSYYIYIDLLSFFSFYLNNYLPLYFSPKHNIVVLTEMQFPPWG